MLTDRQYKILSSIKSTPMTNDEIMLNFNLSSPEWLDLVDLMDRQHLLHRIEENPARYTCSGIGITECKLEKMSRTTFWITKATFACSVASLVIAAASLVISLIAIRL